MPKGDTWNLDMQISSAIFHLKAKAAQNSTLFEEPSTPILMNQQQQMVWEYSQSIYSSLRLFQLTRSMQKIPETYLRSRLKFSV